MRRGKRRNKAYYAPPIADAELDLHGCTAHEARGAVGGVGTYPHYRGKRVTLTRRYCRTSYNYKKLSD
ncbi:MAG: hypothetical protein UU98_C0005G0027 [Parcubacteria group bacterium GW2011_GWD2_42_14]|nr:MAG: hypothetical protein UU98_C0005G0027 [Parcubacteria group bacterium GW2011_GWD2_42_14]